MGGTLCVFYRAVGAAHVRPGGAQWADAGGKAAGRVRPQEPITIGRFEGDENKLLDLYNRGHREGREALDKVRGYLEK